MPLSGASMTSDNTAAAAISRCSASFSTARSGVIAIIVAVISFKLYLPFRHGRAETRPGADCPLRRAAWLSPTEQIGVTVLRYGARVEDTHQCPTRTDRGRERGSPQVHGRKVHE